MEPKLFEPSPLSIEFIQSLPENGIGIHGTTLDRAERIQIEGLAPMDQRGKAPYYYYYKPTLAKFFDFELNFLKHDLNSALIFGSAHRRMSETLALVLFHPLHLPSGVYLNYAERGEGVMDVEYGEIGEERIIGIIPFEGEIPNAYAPEEKQHYDKIIGEITSLLNSSKTISEPLSPAQE